MKLLSFVIPCYNSEGYMRRCIDSILTGGEATELIIVNDGSSDGTARIADEYANAYPTIVKVVHQENGGHGEAINSGLKNASGLFFKVVDSDDWVDLKAYKKIMEVIKALSTQTNVDMIISNFVYEKVGVEKKKVIDFGRAFPENRVFKWDEIGYLKKRQFIMMHSVIFRTQLLKSCGLSLPKHTFYVDNLFVFHPLPHVKTLYYVNVDFYRYFIGREDQSVNEAIMIKRIDQQIKVTKLMIESYLNSKITSKRLENYMVSFLDSVTMVSSTLAIRSGEFENLKKKQELFSFIEQRDKELYRRIRHSFFGWSTHMPGKVGRRFTMVLYKIGRKYVGID